MKLLTKIDFIKKNRVASEFLKKKLMNVGLLSKINYEPKRNTERDTRFILENP